MVAAVVPAVTIGICGNSSNSIAEAAQISEEADAYTGRPGTIVPMVGGASIVDNRRQGASIAIREIVANRLYKVANRVSRDSASSSLRDVASIVAIPRKATSHAGISIMPNSVNRWAVVPCGISSHSRACHAPARAALVRRHVDHNSSHNSAASVHCLDDAVTVAVIAADPVVDQQNAVVAEASSVVAAAVTVEVAVVRNDHCRHRSVDVPVPMQLAVQSNILVLLSTPSISVARSHSRRFVKLPILSRHHSHRRRRRHSCSRGRSKNRCLRTAVLPVCRVHHHRSLNRTSAVPLPLHQRKLATTVAAAVRRAAPRIAMTARMTSSSAKTSDMDPVAAQRVPQRAASRKPQRRSQIKRKALAVQAAAAAASTAMTRVAAMSATRRSRNRSVMRRA